MKNVRLQLDGLEAAFDEYREMTRLLAQKDNPDTTLVSWFDSIRNTHSPSCVKCSIGNAPGWEVYGQSHGGRLRFSINNDSYVFIYD